MARKGEKLSEEHKRKLSEAHKGKKLSAATKKKMSKAQKGITPPVSAGSGIYSFCNKGHWVRSTWELAVADWLWDNDIDYEYEPERFTFNERYSYLPDFYIPSLDLYIEVKGYMTTKNQIQHRLFERRGYNLLIMDDIKRMEEILIEGLAA